MIKNGRESIFWPVLLFGTGGLIYGLIEILWRGYTHWTMVAAGGCCLLLLSWLNERYQKEYLVFRCIKGAILITIVELAAGLICNVRLELSVWDYSQDLGNLAGQICPLYSLFWYFLCYPAFALLYGMQKWRSRH